LAALSIAGYSFFGSYAIIKLIESIPGLELRVPDHQKGCDWAQMGENAYETVDKVSPRDSNNTVSSVA
jgi:ammonia channel protein AmtB